MRLGLVVPGGVDRSGRERVIPVLLWLIERLAKRHDVQVFSLRQYDAPATYPLLGATVRDLGLARAAGGTRRTVHAVRPFLRALREAGSLDLFHAFWAGTTGVLATLAARSRGVPSVVSLGGSEFVSLADIGYGQERTLGGRLQLRLALRLASRVTAASGPMLAAARAAGFRAEEVPLGVDDAWFRETATTPDGPPWRLLHVASLNPVKDQPTLLRAFARVLREEPDVTLDVAGIDTLGGAVQRLAETLGVASRVAFHGHLAVDELRPYFERAHLLVVSSRHEAGPLVALEAAAQRLPVVGTAVGHLADGAPARFVAVPPGDDRALAAEIVRLLRDGALRARLADAAHAWARAHDADETSRRFEALYEALRAAG